MKWRSANLYVLEHIRTPCAVHSKEFLNSAGKRQCWVANGGPSGGRV